MRKIIITLAAFALLLSACSPAAETRPAPVIGEPQISESEAPRVSLEDARAAFDTGAAVFLDARSSASYADSHIAGALSIPLAELEARLGELDATRWIITYCT